MDAETFLIIYSLSTWMPFLVSIPLLWSPITATPLTHCLLQELWKAYQNPPKVCNPEDGNCKVCQCVETPLQSTKHYPKNQSHMLYLTVDNFFKLECHWTSDANLFMVNLPSPIKLSWSAHTVCTHEIYTTLLWHRSQTKRHRNKK
jgi:hypothetical protein